MKNFYFLLLTFFLVAAVGLGSGCSSGGGDDDQAADDDAVDDDLADDDAADDDAADDDAADDDTVADDDTSPPGPLALSVMTYNVMFAFPKDGFDSWKIRGPHEGDIINYHHCDLNGFQEPLPWQVTDLHAYCPGYDDWHYWDTDATEFYLADRFDVLEQGSFWLSPTPGWISIGWGNGMPRLVAWTTLRDRESGREFFWADTHFDNTNPFQTNAAPFFLSEIQTLADGLPIVVTGDFNSRPETDAYHILTEGATPGGFKLDDSFELCGEQYDVRQAPGDHFAIAADIELAAD
jgi:endonuclease/exonuclease/phosphatase family metal-dependent hydrolase